MCLTINQKATEDFLKNCKSDKITIWKVFKQDKDGNLYSPFQNTLVTNNVIDTINKTIDYKTYVKILRVNNNDKNIIIRTEEIHGGAIHGCLNKEAAENLKRILLKSSYSSPLFKYCVKKCTSNVHYFIAVSNENDICVRYLEIDNES